MRIKLPKHNDADDRVSNLIFDANQRKFLSKYDRVSTLIFEADQRKFWSKYLLDKGQKRKADFQMKKHCQAVKTLKTLGYNYVNEN